MLYVSGEESAAQVRLRAERLGRGALEVPIVAETDLDTVVATIEAERPDVCVVDSVQVLHAAQLTGAPGSVGQVREVAGRLMRVAKERGVAVILVGPRDQGGRAGRPAGARAPRGLRAVSFEGERERTYRTLRALKNRFGSTNEAGVFEMRDEGLVEVEDASARFVAEATRAPGLGGAVRRWRARGRCWWRCRRWWRRPSSCRRGGWPTGSTATGSRSCWPCWPATPASRSARADVFVSVAGGVRVDEPGADLAVALAVASAARGVPLGDGARAAGRLRRAGAHRRAAPRRPPRPPAGRGDEVRPGPVLHPGDALPDLRTALRRGLGPAEAAQARGLARFPRSKAKCTGLFPAECRYNASDGLRG